MQGPYVPLSTSTPIHVSQDNQSPMDDSGQPTVMQGPYVPLSTSTPIHVSQDNQSPMDSAPDKASFQQVIPGIPQQSLYPSLAAIWEPV